MLGVDITARVGSAAAKPAFANIRNAGYGVVVRSGSSICAAAPLANFAQSTDPKLLSGYGDALLGLMREVCGVS